MADEKKSAEKAAADTKKDVQSAFDKVQEQGFSGVEVDGTPNENYTVKGVTSGAKVPEAAADPVAARREASNA